MHIIYRERRCVNMALKSLCVCDSSEEKVFRTQRYRKWKRTKDSGGVGVKIIFSTCLSLF